MLGSIAEQFAAFDLRDWFQVANTVATILLGCATYYLGYIVFKRDEPTLTIHMSMSEILSTENKFYGGKQDIIHIGIVNDGRRRVTLGQLGGDLRYSKYKRLLSKIKLHHPYTSCVLKFSPYIHPILKPDGVAKSLEEGENIDIFLPLPEEASLGDEFYNWGKFYIFDSVGRKYYVKPSALRQFRRYFLEWKEQQPQTT